MAWIPFAAAAAPSLINMFTPQPNMPGPSPVNNINMPDRSFYQNQLLQSGFNPQSQLYDIARDRAMASVNSDLANKGMLFSTGGAQNVAMAQADIANKFLENELNRRISSFNSATGYDAQRAQIQLGIGQAQSQDQWNQYGASLGSRQAQMNQWNQLFGAGANAYGSYQQNQNMQQMQSQNQGNFNTYMQYLNSQGNRAPSGGMYSMGPPALSTMNVGGGY